MMPAAPSIPAFQALPDRMARLSDCGGVKTGVLHTTESLRSCRQCVEENDVVGVATLHEM